MFVNTPQAFAGFVQALCANTGPVVFDVETTGLRWWDDARIVGYAVYLPQSRRSYYLPVRHQWTLRCVGWEAQSYQTEKLRKWKHKDVLVETGAQRCAAINLDPKTVRETLQAYLFDGRVPLLGWNVKFDLHMVEAEGCVVPNPVLDVMAAAHMADENERSYDLDSHARKYVEGEKADAPLEEWAHAHGIKGVKGHLAVCPPHLVGEYAEEDCRLTWQLAEWNKARLCAEQPTVFADTQKTLFDLWPEIGGTYLRALGRMERHGLRIDRELAQESIHLAEGKTEELYYAMARLVGHDFNPRSSQQMAQILHLPKTNKAYLATQSDNPLVDLLIDYRQWEKGLRTYYRPWLTLADGKGYLHPNLNVLTVAGRLACREPNLQNLPRMQPEVPAYDVRRAILAPDGEVLVSFDYSQIELRIATHYCMDETWLEVYQSGGDIHQSTADMLGLDRQSCKTLNFAMLYGMGAEGLSSTLTLAGKPTSIEEAKEILYRFRGSKPRLVAFCQQVAAFARRNRYVELWTGRRRHYPRVPSWEDDPARTGVNNVIQGGAAELIRHAITRLDVDFESARAQGTLAPRMHLQIHDDILFSMAEPLLERWLPHIQYRMEHVFAFHVPIVADCKIGPRWAEMKKREVPRVRQAA